jgi:predicted nucleic acid-binding protein
LIALDTNILAYAEQPDDPEGRHEKSLLLMERLTLGGNIVPVQVLGEFINICRRKKLLPISEAAAKAELYAQIFETPRTAAEDLVSAAKLLENYNLQYFDALIITVATRAGATMLLSEDMQDGLEVAGLRVVNPFLVGNEEVIEGALRG